VPPEKRWLRKDFDGRQPVYEHRRTKLDIMLKIQFDIIRLPLRYWQRIATLVFVIWFDHKTGNIW